jgi:hypothetical protein
MNESKPPPETWSERFEREANALWILVRKRPLLGVALAIALLFYGWHSFFKGTTLVPQFGAQETPATGSTGAEPQDAQRAQLPAGGAGPIGSPPALPPSTQTSTFDSLTLDESDALMHRFAGPATTRGADRQLRLETYLRDAGSRLSVDNLVNSELPEARQERKRAVILLRLTPTPPDSSTVLFTWLRSADGTFIPTHRGQLEGCMRTTGAGQVLVSDFLLLTRYGDERRRAISCLGIDQ